MKVLNLAWPKVLGKSSKARAGAAMRRHRRAVPGAERLEDRALLAAPYYGYAMNVPYPNGITSLSNGDEVVTGMFEGTANFDPNNSSDTAATLSTPSYYDSSGNLRYTPSAYVANYDPNGNLVWVHALSDPSGSNGLKLVTDSSGNIYAGGSFNSTITVGADSNGNPVTVTGSSTSWNDYLVKYAPDGTVQWGVSLAGTNLNGLAADPQGDIYVPGYFTGTVSVGGKTMSAANGQYYLAKVGSNGSFAWVDQSAAQINGVAADGNGNVYFTGNFHGTVDFDPGSGSYTMYSGGRKVQPSDAAYVEKLNAAGGFVWAEGFQAGQWSGSNGIAIALDSAGNVYTTGSYGGTVDFNPASKGTYDLPTSGGVYVSKLSPTGQFVWAKQVGASSTGESVAGIAVDPLGNVDMAGTFSGTGNFDPDGTDTLTAAGSSDAFVVQLTGSGGFNWAASTTGAGAAAASSIATDASGDVYVVGTLSGTVNFDPSGTHTLTGQTPTDGYGWKLTE